MRRFRNKATEAMYNGEFSRQLPPDIRRTTQRKLFMVVRARSLGDLRSPPSNRLEALRGDRAGQYSIRINDQWRVCFSWSDDGAVDIDVVDYH